MASLARRNAGQRSLVRDGFLGQRHKIALVVGQILFQLNGRFHDHSTIVAAIGTAYVVGVSRAALFRWDLLLPPMPVREQALRMLNAKLPQHLMAR